MSLLLLKFNRGRIKRDSRTPLSTLIAALVLSAVVFAGNVAVEPATAGSAFYTYHILYVDFWSSYFAGYFLGIILIFTATQNKIHLLRWAYWIYDQYPVLHVGTLTKTWGDRLITSMAHLKRQPVCIFVKTDEVCYLCWRAENTLMSPFVD